MDYELALRGMEIIRGYASSFKVKSCFFSCIDDADADVFEGLFTFERTSDLSKFNDWGYLRRILEKAGIVTAQCGIVDNLLLLHISDKRLCVFMLRTDNDEYIESGDYFRYLDGCWSWWRFLRNGIKREDRRIMKRDTFLKTVLSSVIAYRGIDLLDPNGRRYGQVYMQKMTDLCGGYSGGISRD